MKVELCTKRDVVFPFLLDRIFYHRTDITDAINQQSEQCYPNTFDIERHSPCKSM